MTVKKKIFWITLLIIVSAIVIVLCVGYFNGRKTEYDGTLVRVGMDISSYSGFYNINNS